VSALDMHPPAATVPMSPAEPTSSDVEIVFTGIESQLDLDDQSPPTVTRRRRSVSAGSEMPVEKGEFLIYTQTVSCIVSSIAIRALLYPVDAIIVRLMADQAGGLTRFGYRGFFNCLGRIRRSPTQGLTSLYAGFTPSLLSDLALGWLTAELAHYFCKSAWNK
ncbi:hypothetical protein GGI13_008174, partial [Coemansia sp. RSA 455]